MTPSALEICRPDRGLIEKTSEVMGLTKMRAVPSAVRQAVSEEDLSNRLLVLAHCPHADFELARLHLKVSRRGLAQQEPCGEPRRPSADLPGLEGGPGGNRAFVEADYQYICHAHCRQRDDFLPRAVNT